MNTCIESSLEFFDILIADNNSVDYLMTNQLCRCVSGLLVNVSEDKLVARIGNYSDNHANAIKTNDSYKSVTTSVTENEKDGAVVVKIYFEVENPTAKALMILDKISDMNCLTAIINYKNITDGKVSRKYIVDGRMPGQVSTKVSYKKGVANVTIEVATVSGLQLVI